MEERMLLQEAVVLGEAILAAGREELDRLEQRMRDLKREIADLDRQKAERRPKRLD